MLALSIGLGFALASLSTWLLSEAIINTIRIIRTIQGKEKGDTE